MLEVIQISKSFPGVKALDQVNMKCYPGQVNAILGENGAGKSTLLKIITGVYSKYEGEIHLNGKPVHFNNVREAQEAGIAIIHQELNLIPHLTVAENIFLGREIRTPLGWMDQSTMSSQTNALLEKLHLKVVPKTKVHQLRVGEQQLIEIAKALLTDADVILMDEPTSALSNVEINNLHRIIQELKAAGKTIVYISHKMEELFRIADRYVVLRDGKMVGAGDMDQTDEPSLIRLMVGREVQVSPKTSTAQSNRNLLKVERLNLLHPTQKGRKLLEDISFELKKREILGIFGLMGAGRTELLQTLFGLYPNRSSYHLELEGQVYRFNSPRDAIQAGLAFVTEDRKAEGLILEMGIVANISLTNQPSLDLIYRRKEKALAQRYAEQLRIKTPSVNQLCQNLSGGNQQKVVLAKWLATGPKILFMDEPTRGIDINAKNEVYELMKKLVAEDLSILLVSSEIPEILALSDRVLVMAEGRITASFTAEKVTEDQLLKAALSAQGNLSFKT